MKTVTTFLFAFISCIHTVVSQTPEMTNITFPDFTSFYKIKQLYSGINSIQMQYIGRYLLNKNNIYSL